MAGASLVSISRRVPPHGGDRVRTNSVLHATGRREVAEEIGVDLTGIQLTYVESGSFVTDDGDPVVNVVLPEHCRPVRTL